MKSFKRIMVFRLEEQSVIFFFNLFFFFFLHDYSDVDAYP